MQCWFWNIEMADQTYFEQELKRGHLRQGWGYNQRLDLRKLQEKVNQNMPLDEEEQAAWDRCQSMLRYIKEGDLVAVKNIPTNKHFTLVKVTGEYQFDLGERGDYGHRLPITIIREFHKNNAILEMPFVSALNREQHPINITHKHKQFLQTLFHLVTADPALNTLEPQPFKERIERCRRQLFPTLKEALQKGLDPKRTEKLMFELLRRDGIDVEMTAGCNERGADLLGIWKLDYGLTVKVAVQIKAHWDGPYDDDDTGINQLERAFREHKVTAALFVTTAEQLGEKLQRRIQEAKNKYNIEVLYGDKLYRRILELIADPDFDLAD